MRVITLEEHFRSKYADEWATEYVNRFSLAGGALGAKLGDIGAGRIAEMDNGGIDVQILSHTVPSPEILEPARAIPCCQRVNDEMAEEVSRNPKRFAGFACLPIANAPAAADELERAVRELGFVGCMISGATQGRFLDDPTFWPILERAEALQVPIYLHPAPPPKAVMDVYFSGLDEPLASMLSIAGWGWHAELALHTLRLIVSGAFDRFPKLQLIIGHMGEMIPFQIARIDQVLSRATKNLKQRPSAYFQSNIHITTSGLFTAPPLYLALEVLGADRIMFSIDYPYSGTETGRRFLDNLYLSPGDLERITHRNAERLLRLNAEVIGS
jgi:uncharacterized protein